MLSPNEIASGFVSVGIKKTASPSLKLLLLGIFAGVFIALAGAGSAIASATIPDPSLGRFVNAMVFPAGLVMVLLAGSELFTGNSLILISVLEKQVTVFSMLRNWFIVYLGNFIGSFLIALAFVYSHVPDLFGGSLTNTLVACAVNKTSLSFGDAFLRGILCNILVCIAVWVTSAESSAHGKIIVLFLPIVVFVLCGFEHCVANMFSIPAGLLCVAEYGLTANTLSWGGMFLNNLLPVTLGNILGGSLVALGYWGVYLHGKNET